MKILVNSSAWLITAFLFFFVSYLTAQSISLADPKLPATTGSIATIEFEKTSYDFGTVEDGTKVSQIFTFTNTSDEPLILLDAKGSCGCTVPQWPREPVMPGETASLTVEFNSKNKSGKRNQKVTLTANTNPPQTFIYLTGEIIPRDENTTSISENKKEETINPDCFAIYPNPTAEILKLEIEKTNLGKSAIISIHSQTGQLMAKREIEVIDGTIEFNVSHYPAGTYIANMQVADHKPQSRCFVVVE